MEGPADVVVELRSPNDETDEKIDWYAARGVRELLIIEPAERRVELLRHRDERRVPVPADADGSVQSEVLGVRLAAAPGPRLVVRWPDGQAEI